MVKQERAVRTRENLIRSAAEVFEREGYALASLTAISSRAGVSNGALHFHFASKEELAREVEGAAAEVVQKMAESCRDSADTLLHSLADATCRLLDTVAGDPLVRAGFRLGRDPSRKSGEGGLWRWWCAWVQDLVSQAQEKGELAQGVSPEDAVAAIVAATAGFEVLGTWSRDWLSGERATRFWTLLLPLLAAPPRQAPGGPDGPREPGGPPGCDGPVGRSGLTGSGGEETATG
ncbi:ScbR family autoregulator-binding transcription factor [Streptomyces puniciscabiei]|uniref:ScbR family autoregulator-binding transcription factor n=1 Tax=Streptomyces puniciscabiei TaxID=164348 RepID=UPI00331D29DA